MDVRVMPAGSIMDASETQQFTAIVEGTSDTTVTWSIYPHVGFISATGLYRAPSSITSEQRVTITATSNADRTNLSIAIVTLRPPPPRVESEQTGGAARGDEILWGGVPIMWPADWGYGSAPPGWSYWGDPPYGWTTPNTILKHDWKNPILLDRPMVVGRGHGCLMDQLVRPRDPQLTTQTNWRFRPLSMDPPFAGDLSLLCGVNCHE